MYRKGIAFHSVRIFGAHDQANGVATPVKLVGEPRYVGCGATDIGGEKVGY